MGRRKTLRVVELPSGGIKVHQSPATHDIHELLEQKYQEALSAVRPATLYAKSTLHHVDRIESLLLEYCREFKLDARQILQECSTARIENFLHWLLQKYTIKKTSTVTTYWRQLSQLHILWTQRRIDPQVLRQIFVFIEGPLTEEYGLDNSETEKPLLEAEEFIKLIRYHWASDINVFPNERQRLQLAAILLLAAFTGSRPHALLSITYRDLNLYVERNAKTNTDSLKLGVQLTKTKSGKKRKRPKTYTFCLDDNPVFCIITHIVSIAFDDQAFAAPGLDSPDILFRLRAKKESGHQQITWRSDILDTPIFRRTIMTKQGVRTSPTCAIPDGIYQSWLRRLGEALGYVKTLTTYCLRRAVGNAINDDPDSSAAVRNLVLDHVGSSTIFERNYLSRMIRYSTQDTFWQREADHESAKAASRIGRHRDLNRPTGLGDEHRRQVRQSRAVLDLIEIRDRVRAKIRSQYGALKKAEGEPIYISYQELCRTINSTIRAQERALLKQIQEEHDAAAPVEDIQKQIQGEFAEAREPAPEDVVVIKIAERRNIAEAALSDPSRFTGLNSLVRHVKCAANMIALCTRRENRPPKTRHTEMPIPVKRQGVAESETSKERTAPLQCKGFQCLFCLASNLPPEDQQRIYTTKFSLQRHVDRCRLSQYGADESIPCPDEVACGGVQLMGKTRFKNHGARVHNFFL